jgi:light-regulated signal transduction histidine kinase (bacteriophytochrome)
MDKNFAMVGAKSTGGLMDTAQELTVEAQGARGVGIQPAAYLLELSLDWIVLRASENVYRLLGESHVTLIEEPLGRFVHSQALHDLRNLFSRLSGTTGIGRAYGIRLTDEPELVDVSFQVSQGRVILEAVPSSGAFGECFGSVGGLISGLAQTHGQALLDNAARRMRALTGYDRVTLFCGDERAESSRGAFGAPAALDDELPTIVSDAVAETVAIFPRDSEESSAGDALLSCCSPKACAKLANEGVRASLRVPFTGDGAEGEFRCDSRTTRDPSFELHAAAELFAQLFAMRLEIDRLKKAD